MIDGIFAHVPPAITKQQAQDVLDVLVECGAKPYERYLGADNKYNYLRNEPDFPKYIGVDIYNDTVLEDCKTYYGNNAQQTEFCILVLEYCKLVGSTKYTNIHQVNSRLQNMIIMIDGKEFSGFAEEEKIVIPSPYSPVTPPSEGATPRKRHRTWCAAHESMTGDEYRCDCDNFEYRG